MFQKAIGGDDFFLGGGVEKGVESNSQIDAEKLRYSTGNLEMIWDC